MSAAIQLPSTSSPDTDDTKPANKDECESGAVTFAPGTPSELLWSLGSRSGVISITGKKLSADKVLLERIFSASIGNFALPWLQK
jgi:hypothetical protein